MWVYPQKEPESESESATVPAVQLPAESPPETALQVLPPSDPPGEAAALLHPPRKTYATKDCCLLAAAYLLGTAAAGWLQALCDARQLELLNYYLSVWRGLFAVTDLHAAAGLFLAEYMALTIIATALLLAGFSALGPVLIFFLTMAYGLGSGLLAASLFAGLQWNIVLRYLVLAGVPAAGAAGCLCVFGALALQVSARIRAYSFRRQTGQTFPAAGVLMGQYALTLVLLLPLCGAATGLAYLGAAS